MDTFMIMLKNVLIFVLLAVPGYLLVRGKVLTAKESGTLSKLLTNIGMPFLILSSALKLEFNGELTKKLTVKVDAFSEGAKAKIEACGGTCEVI